MTTACAPMAAAIRAASALAPPMWPERIGTAKRPASSRQTTAGSAAFPRSRGAIIRTTAPIAITKTWARRAWKVRATASRIGRAKGLAPGRCRGGDPLGDVELRVAERGGEPARDAAARRG